MAGRGGLGKGEKCGYSKRNVHARRSGRGHWLPRRLLGPGGGPRDGCYGEDAGLHGGLRRRGHARDLMRLPGRTARWQVEGWVRPVVEKGEGVGCEGGGHGASAARDTPSFRFNLLSWVRCLDPTSPM